MLERKIGGLEDGRLQLTVLWKGLSEKRVSTSRESPSSSADQVLCMRAERSIARASSILSAEGSCARIAVRLVCVDIDDWSSVFDISSAWTLRASRESSCEGFRRCVLRRGEVDAVGRKINWLSSSSSSAGSVSSSASSPSLYSGGLSGQAGWYSGKLDSLDNRNDGRL